MISFADPYLVIRWHDVNIARAALGGPYLDAVGNNDPRSAHHLETFLSQQPGAQLYEHPFYAIHVLLVIFDRLTNKQTNKQTNKRRFDDGMIKFVTLDDALNAVRNMMRRFPWVLPGHASHPANPGALPLATGSHDGDIVTVMAVLSAPSKGQLERS
jgi:hypothetical protein